MRVRSIALTALLVGVAVVSAIPVSAATEPDRLVAMDDFAPAAYAREAAKLPYELVEALEDGPGVTPSEYLAQADAARNAATTVASLTDAGYPVLGSRMDGTRLTINVGDAAAAAVVTRLGATPKIGAPVVPSFDLSAARLADTDSASGGDAIFWETKAGTYRCSLGFNGRSVKSGKDALLTAGHCTGKKILNSGYYQTRAQDKPTYYGGMFAPSRTLGKPVAGSFKLGSGHDSGLVAYGGTGKRWANEPTVREGQSAAGNGSLTPVYDQVVATVGATACKSGSTTGWTCGEILAVNYAAKVTGAKGTINSIVMDGCMLGGDSGGAALMGDFAIGVNSWSSFGKSCSNAKGDKISAFFPLVSASSSKASVAKRLAATWELSVAVASPTVSNPSEGEVIPYGSDVAGSIPFGSTRHAVEVYIDGAPSSSKAKVGSDGEWTVALTDVVPGDHTLQVRGTWGTLSHSSLTSARAFTVDEPPLYSMSKSATKAPDSVAQSRAQFSGTAPVVYLSAGAVPLDTLAAIAAADRDGAPLLFVPRDALPGVTVAELERLSPSKIVIVGDANAVSDSVKKQLRALAKTVVVTPRAKL